MSDIIIRKEGRAGRITLNRPQSLNALTWDMCRAIEATLDDWRSDKTVSLVMIDGAGDRAFCSGGDIADMYKSGQEADFEYGRKFWRDEYRLNAKIAAYEKPIVTFLHGFTMGGGVGVGCHASHRLVCETSEIAMPECSIGLIPDVGGTYLLGRAPGQTGTYLGLTGDRMDAGDAIFAGFADHFVPKAEWADLIRALVENGQPNIPTHPAPTARLEIWQDDLSRQFAKTTAAEIVAELDDSASGQTARKAIARNSPLAMACALPLIQESRENNDLNTALGREYCFTHRAVEHSDFIEGIRAAIIDRDRSPAWKHQNLSQVNLNEITEMTAPLGADRLTF